MESRFCVGETVTNTFERFPDDFGCNVACDKSGNTFDTPDTNSYLYNARSELTNATAAVDSDYRYGYNFDDIGNRKTSAERGMWNSEYTANNLNQYTTITSQTARASEAVRTYYDADGNQIRVKTATGTWQVSYNGENRPVRWQQGPTVITMSFDRMGRRVTKNDQRFVYNGYLQIANFRSTTTTSDYNYFVWDCTENVATRPLAWLVLRSLGEGGQRGTSVAYYTHDGNKNVSEVIASNNDVAAHYEYAPFGALTAQRGVSAAANPWHFSSEYAEDDTATVYYNYRHYEPVTGRWMSRDVLWEFRTQDIYQLGLDRYRGRLVSPIYRLYSFIGNCDFLIDHLGLGTSGRYDPPPEYVEFPVPMSCCSRQRMECNTVCSRYKQLSKALCDMNIFGLHHRCRCVCYWLLKTPASSGFPGWSRDFDCTYVHPNGLREYTIGYYSQPTWFKCPRYIKLGCD